MTLSVNSFEKVPPRSSVHLAMLSSDIWPSKEPATAILQLLKIFRTIPRMADCGSPRKKQLGEGVWGALCGWRNGRCLKVSGRSPGGMSTEGRIKKNNHFLGSG